MIIREIWAQSKRGKACALLNKINYGGIRNEQIFGIL